jgi:hypothetical protein
MNCLQYALEFWEKNPKYRLWYNSDHVINLPLGSTATGFSPIEDFGFDYFFKWYEDRLINEHGCNLLFDYFGKN